jgi:hypothetical protein
MDCTTLCTSQADAAFDECARSGGTSEACEASRITTYEACVAGCGP